MIEWIKPKDKVWTCHFIFFSLWTESYDYQSKDSNDNFKIDFTCFSLVWSVSETSEISYVTDSFTTTYWYIMTENSNYNNRSFDNKRYERNTL